MKKKPSHWPLLEDAREKLFIFENWKIKGKNETLIFPFLGTLSFSE